MIIMWYKQHLSNIWTSVHEKVNTNTKAELKKKKTLFMKKACDKVILKFWCKYE